MNITLTRIQNGESFSLAKTLSACASAELEVALCRLTYYHQWYIVRAALDNHKIGENGHTTLVSDGYYNVCELNEEVFQPLAAGLHLHAPIGH